MSQNVSSAAVVIRAYKAHTYICLATKATDISDVSWFNYMLQTRDQTTTETSSWMRLTMSYWYSNSEI